LMICFYFHFSANFQVLNDQGFTDIFFTRYALCPLRYAFIACNAQPAPRNSLRETRNP
jgi:hypothetical protein